MPRKIDQCSPIETHECTAENVRSPWDPVNEHGNREEDPQGRHRVAARERVLAGVSDRGAFEDRLHDEVESEEPSEGQKPEEGRAPVPPEEQPERGHNDRQHHEDHSRGDVGVAEPGERVRLVVPRDVPEDAGIEPREVFVGHARGNDGEEGEGPQGRGEELVHERLLDRAPLNDWSGRYTAEVLRPTRTLPSDR